MKTRIQTKTNQYIQQSGGCCGPSPHVVQPNVQLSCCGSNSQSNTVQSSKQEDGCC